MTVFISLTYKINNNGPKIVLQAIPFAVNVFFPCMCKNATKPMLQHLEAFYLARIVKYPLNQPLT